MKFEKIKAPIAKFKKLLTKKITLKKPKAKIYSLAPDPDLKNDKNEYYDIYKKRLDAVFADKSIRNTAVVGSYGIGKSSLIRTYEKDTGKKFLYISPMTGTKEEPAPVDDKGKGDDEKRTDDVLEITLLRQILASCKRINVPRLRFRIIPENTRFTEVKALLLAFYIVTLLVMIFSENVSDILHTLDFDFLGLGTIIVKVLFFAQTLIYAFLLSSHILRNMRFKQISLKLSGKNIEGSADSCEESILDEYRFELLYVLENLSKKYDAVIFEDMDRADEKTCCKIFHQLRDINNGLNSRKRKPLRFFYVVNDSITGKVDQTKFFDYIMSVYPTLSFGNSCEKFNELVLKELNINLSPNNLEAISTVVKDIPALQDYRTLNHIRNEYVLLKEVTKKVRKGVYEANLLAFVIYKTLMPDDYDNIKKGCSHVYPKMNEPVRNYILSPLRELLTDPVCILFLGWSREERKNYYMRLLDNSIEPEKYLGLCSEDSEFVFLDIIKTYINNGDIHIHFYNIYFCNYSEPC